MISASVGPSSTGGLPGPARYWASSLKGPSLPLAIPLAFRHITSQRLVTIQTRSPSTAGEEQSPRYSQSLILPVPSLGTANCQRNLPVFSSKHIRIPRSPTSFGLRGASLLVPTNTLPPATVGLP